MQKNRKKTKSWLKKKKSHSTSLVCILVNLYSFLFLWLPNPSHQELEVNWIWIIAQIDFRTSYSSTLKYHEKAISSIHAVCVAEHWGCLQDQIHCGCRQWPRIYSPRYDSTVSKGACKLLCARAHPVHYHSNKSRQAGCWLTAGVHMLSQSGRCRQVEACSQPLPRLLLWGGVNVAARDDSRLLLFGLSLARFYMWKESYEERSRCYQNDEEKWIDEGLRT